MNTAELSAAFTRIAGSLRTVNADSDESLGTVSYAIGALYGFRRAHTLGYHDRTTSVSRLGRASEIERVAADLVRSDRVASSDWLAGWYYNSGLEHLDAAASRLNAVTKVARSASRSQRDAPIGTVAYDVGHLKHRPVGLGDGRGVDIGPAVAELEQLAERLAAHFGKAG